MVGSLTTSIVIMSSKYIKINHEFKKTEVNNIQNVVISRILQKIHRWYVCDATFTTSSGRNMHIRVRDSTVTFVKPPSNPVVVVLTTSWSEIQL